jgi:hypothetical protein
VWFFTRSGTVWTQQGSKVVGTGAVGNAQQGISVALSGDGNTAIVGGNCDNSTPGCNGTRTGAAWVFTRSGGVWTQQGSKLVGTGAVGTTFQGESVAVSADGNTAIVGGSGDNSGIGAAWVFAQAGGTLQVSPATGIAASGIEGQLFSPASVDYQLSSTGRQRSLFYLQDSGLAHCLCHLGHAPAHSFRHLHCERLRSQPRQLRRNHRLHQYGQRPRQHDPSRGADRQSRHQT